ncbi:ABC transporter permease [Candidatus Kaiserbacteria bacterium]|nr:ABC transporter permease [Candidatus Kaiserbacteria bacterium]
MPFKHVLLTALQALESHKSRSALTILGIVIGVAAIIMVMSLGKGAEAMILGEVSGLGPETVILRPGNSLTDFTQTLYSQTITKKDIEALKRKQNVPNLVEIAPLVITYESVEYQGDLYRPSIMGAPAEFIANLFDIGLSEGHLYTDDDIDQEARVAIIGSEIKNDLFGSSRAVGKQVKIKDKKFKVIGVFEDKGNVGGFNIDTLVLIPQTSVQTYITGTDYFAEVMIRADSPENAEKLAYDVEVTLRDVHDLSFHEENDFNITTQEETIEMIQTIVTIFTSFLITVVAISLVVGGVGIMNIMLVSVSERTKEIGLRKALGATRQDILNQFLSEAIILTSLGGVIGIIIGASFSFLAALILSQTVAEGWEYIFPVGGSLLGVGVSAGVGLLFGIYPANQAAKKSPIEALRYE